MPRAGRQRPTARRASCCGLLGLRQIDLRLDVYSVPYPERAEETGVGLDPVLTLHDRGRHAVAVLASPGHTELDRLAAPRQRERAGHPAATAAVWLEISRREH